MSQKIYLGADHAGWERKEFIKNWLTADGLVVEDLSSPEFDPNDDYPDVAFAVAKKVSAEPETRGILVCANGQGMCIAANKIKGIRAALGHNAWAVETSRHDDDTNVLCLPSKIISDDEIREIIDVWLKTEFAGEERFVRRIEKIEKI